MQQSAHVRDQPESFFIPCTSLVSRLRPKRRHQKSRLGCQACKKRRVKVILIIVRISLLYLLKAAHSVMKLVPYAPHASIFIYPVSTSQAEKRGWVWSHSNWDKLKFNMVLMVMATNAPSKPSGANVDDHEIITQCIYRPSPASKHRDLRLFQTYSLILPEAQARTHHQGRLPMFLQSCCFISSPTRGLAL